MNRQLYMGGGIMNAMPREQYGLGSSLTWVAEQVLAYLKKLLEELKN